MCHLSGKSNKLCKFTWTLLDSASQPYHTLQSNLYNWKQMRLAGFSFYVQIMNPFIIPKNSKKFYNFEWNPAHYIKHIIHSWMDLLRLWASKWKKQIDHSTIDGKPRNYGLLQYHSKLINDGPPSPMGILSERQPMVCFSIFPDIKIFPASKITCLTSLTRAKPKEKMEFPT